MARGLNKVMLIRNLGQAPEVRFMPSGGAVANINIATTEVWTDKESGQRQERTEWHKVVFFNKLAEVAQQYLKKGSKVYVEGKLQTRKWQDQNGIDRYSTEIVSNDMQMLDGANQAGGQQQNAPAQNAQQNAPAQNAQQNAPAQNAQQNAPAQNAQQNAPQNAPAQNAPQNTPAQNASQNAPAQNAPQNAPAQNAPQSNYGAPDPGNFDDFDDEIPF